MIQQSRLLRDNPSDFPYDFEKQILSKQSSNTIYHWHPELEIVYVKKGTATFYINSERFESHEGDIFLIQPTSPHAIYPIENQEQISIVFRIHLDFLGRSQIDSFSQRYIQPLYSGHFYLTPRISPDDHAYEQICDCLLSLFSILEEQSIYYDLLLKAKLYEFLYLLFRYRYVNRHYTDDTYQKYQKLKEMIGYLEQHYAEPIQIDQLAATFGYSKNHFMNIFKQHTGTSCMEYLIRLRLEKACEKLVQTNQSVQEIASQVGFTNLSNFNRQFKQHFQLTPRQYRNQQLKKES